AIRWLGSCSLDLGGLDIGLDGSGNSRRDFVLQGEDVAQVSLVAISPDVAAARRLDQLSRYSNAGASLPHAALDDIAHAELAADLPDVGRPGLVEETRMARDHEQPLHA